MTDMKCVNVFILLVVFCMPISFGVICFLVAMPTCRKEPDLQRHRMADTLASWTYM